MHFYPNSIPFNKNESECAECKQVSARNESNADQWHAKMVQDKRDFSFLTQSSRLIVDFPLSSKAPFYGRFFLIEGKWAKQMKDHLAEKVQTIPGLTSTSSLLCEHGKLRFNPVPVDQFPPFGPPHDVPGTKVGELALVDEHAWKQIIGCDRYLRESSANMPAIQITFSKGQSSAEQKSTAGRGQSGCEGRSRHA